MGVPVGEDLRDAHRRLLEHIRTPGVVVERRA
jgi:hypothetical protein